MTTIDTSSKSRPHMTKIQLACTVATRGAVAIKSDDPEAITKLTARITELEEARAVMKAKNAALRLNSVIRGNEALRALGIAEAMIEQARREGPFEAWQMQNIGQNVTRLRKRITAIEAEAERAPAKDVEGEGYRIVENTDLGRIQIVFDEKPEESARRILKSEGFRWAPSQEAWQRHLNANGRSAVRRALYRLAQAT